MDYRDSTDYGLGLDDMADFGLSSDVINEDFPLEVTAWKVRSHPKLVEADVAFQKQYEVYLGNLPALVRLGVPTEGSLEKDNKKKDVENVLDSYLKDKVLVLVKHHCPDDTAKEQALRVREIVRLFKKKGKDLLTQSEQEPSLRIAVSAPATDIAAKNLPDLDATEEQAFRLYAKANPWKGSGMKPAAFIVKNYDPWLKKGLPLALIAKVDPRLARAYTVETSRHKDRKVVGVYVQPKTAPADAPTPVYARRINELTEEQAKARRISSRVNKQKYRASLHSAAP